MADSATGGDGGGGDLIVHLQQQLEAKVAEIGELQRQKEESAKKHKIAERNSELEQDNAKQGAEILKLQGT